MKRFPALLLVLVVAVVAASILPPVAQAQGPQVWDYGRLDYCAINGVATIQGLQCVLQNVFSVAITFIGLAAFVMLIVGSFGYLLSGGNSKGTEQARNTITFAVVGIVVALSAFIILNFVSIFTGVEEVTNFTIPESGNGTSVLRPQGP